MKGETLNALTKFFAGDAENTPGADPLIGKSASPAKARKLTTSEHDELLELFARNLAADLREGEAAARYQKRARWIDEIGEAIEQGETQSAALLRKLKTARGAREELEAQLRTASDAEAQIVESLRIEQGTRENRIADLHQQLEQDANDAYPRLELLREWLERQVQETRCYGPGFIFHLPGRERDEAEARGEPRTGQWDPVVHKLLGARLLALQAALRQVQVLKRRALTASEETDAITGLVAGVPPVPDAASKMVAIPPDVELPR